MKHKEQQKHFGKNALEVIYESPEKLAKVQGISKNKANEISQEYREKREFFNILEYLKKYNVEIPIIEQVNAVLFENKNAAEAVNELMIRDKKLEIQSW